MKFVFGNAQDRGAREQQQDAFGFSNPFDDAFTAHGGFAAILADGMGGLEAGDLAARTAVAAFLSAYKAKNEQETIPLALRRALLAANQAVCELGRDLGTTLIAAVLQDGTLHWISVGDSGLFVYRAGAFQQLNTLHVYARELDAKAEAGVISREAALADPQRDALTCHLGMATLAEIDEGVRPLSRGESVIAASDGLFKVLPLAEAPPLTGTLQERCDALVAVTLGRRAPGQDNVTVIALALSEEAPALPAAAAPGRPLLVAALALAASLLIGAVLLPRFSTPPPPPTPRTYLKPVPVLYEDIELNLDQDPRPRKDVRR